MPTGKAENLYIRNGNYLTGDETYNYIIKRDNFRKENKFYRIYNIKSSSDWLIPIQKKTYIRNDQTASISVKFAMDKLKEPGLYTGKITGTRDDKTNIPEFEMWATIVIPYQFNQANNHSLKWQNKKLAPGEIERYFIEIPAGASAMDINLSSVSKEFSDIRFWLFKPDGSEMYLSPALNSTDENESIEKDFYNISPGVYELDIEGSYKTEKNSNYNLSVQFSGIKNLDSESLDSVNNSIDVINLYDKAESYDLSGKILGYETDLNIELNGQDTCVLPFTLRRDEASKEFEIKLSKNDFNKITDFSLLIYDMDGNAKEKDAMSYREGSIEMNE